MKKLFSSYTVAVSCGGGLALDRAYPTPRLSGGTVPTCTDPGCSCRTGCPLPDLATQFALSPTLVILKILENCDFEFI